MLTAAADPRRANWLALGGSDCGCWPGEGGGARPPWELEAEVLRLTTRLMIRERELRQVRAQLKAQASKAAAWRSRAQEQAREQAERRDAEMRGVASQLLLLEAELRGEQRRIEALLRDREARIRAQAEEIRRLRRRPGAPDKDALRTSWAPERDSSKTPDSADRDHSPLRMEDSILNEFDAACLTMEDSKTSHLLENDFRKTPDLMKNSASEDNTPHSPWRMEDSDLEGDFTVSHSLEKDLRKELDCMKDSADRDHSPWRMEESSLDILNPTVGDWKISYALENNFRKASDSMKDNADRDHLSLKMNDSIFNEFDVRCPTMGDWKMSHSIDNGFRKVPGSMEDSSKRDHSPLRMDDSAPNGRYPTEGDWKMSHSLEKDSCKVPDLTKDSADRDPSPWRMKDSLPDSVHVVYHDVDDWKMSPSNHYSETDHLRKTLDSRKGASDKEHSSRRVEDSVPDSIHVGYIGVDDRIMNPPNHPDSLKTPYSRKDWDHASWRIEGKEDYRVADHSTRPSRRADHGNQSPEKGSKNRVFRESSWRIEDSVWNPVDSQEAARKLRNGLTKIRAVQDVTNVKSLGSSSCDILPAEKKKVPSRPPQKMKDLKAKRINHHKAHRSVMNEIGGQAIL